MRPSLFFLISVVFECRLECRYGNLTGALSPWLKRSVVSDFYGYGHVLDYALRDKVSAGAIDWRLGVIESFDKTGVLVDDGSESSTVLDADVVIYGTGFSKNYDLFDAATRAKLNPEQDGLYLYRNTVPTSVSNLAFVGSELATIMNITTYGLQAWWLAKLWDGEVAYDKDQAELEVAAVKAWKRTWMPDTPARASLILLHQTHFHDRLLKDMGLPHRRQFNPISELLTAQESKHYDGVIGK